MGRGLLYEACFRECTFWLLLFYSFSLVWLFVCLVSADLRSEVVKYRMGRYCNSTMLEVELEIGREGDRG